MPETAARCCSQKSWSRPSCGSCLTAPPGFTARRFIAADWDLALPDAMAAEKAGAPIAGLGIARMPIEPT
jgi:hypothetical protein